MISKNLNHCLENQKGYYLRNIEKYGKMLMLQFISGRLISFWNLFIYVNNSQYIIYMMISSLYYTTILSMLYILFFIW